MKKSFMTRVLAVSLSTAMAFSMSSASNLMTASAASTVNLNTTFKTLKVNQTYKLSLKNNTLNWKITKVTTTDKKICTVYGKTSSYVMLKGKGVGRATITVKAKTTKRKYPNNIKLMKCRANVTAANTPVVEAFSATAAANSNTEVRVSFNQAVDDDAATVSNYTVSDGVTVTKAELSEDKKSVLLTIAGAEYGKNYDLTVTGIKVGGTAQAEQKLSFTTPQATVTNQMTLEPKDKILKSDGQSQTLVTFTLKDAEGKPVTDEGVQVEFATSLGKFADNGRVTLQNGEASIMYVSAALMEQQTATITATVVESTNNQKLLGLTTSSSITLSPDPDALSVGAVITSVVAPTADRVIAYFNQAVKADDFKNGKKLDKTKFDCKIISGLDNGFVSAGVSQEVEVVGIMDVPGTDNALQLLVKEPMMDNSNVSVEFTNKVAKNNQINPSNKVYCRLADARQPAVLNATSDGTRKITIEFSEAVLPKQLTNENDVTTQLFAANNRDNYTIDGIPLSQLGVPVANEKYAGDETEDSLSGDLKIDNKKDSAVAYGTDEDDGSIEVGSYKEGEDNRHKVTITLGRKYALSAGTHTVSISNVGDWAAKTDRERNIVSTGSQDFTITANDVVPTFTVEEMSPEQYLLTFNSDINILSTADTIKTPNSAQDASIIRLQQQVGGSWVDISDSDGKGKNPIMVSRVDDVANQYLVEVRKDWTEVYNTSSSRYNYHNYNLRLHMDEGKIVNTVNNRQNAEINFNLDGSIMKNPDTTSPEIIAAEQAEDKNGNLLESYNVTFSEPVKLTVEANAEGLTPSEEQQAKAGTGSNSNEGVPIPSAEFIRVDNGQTVNGVITTKSFVNAYDTKVNITPDTPLTAGNWNLVVTSVSDDYGRTMSTYTYPLEVVRDTASTDFRIVWAAVQGSTGNINEDIIYDESKLGRGNGRVIFVKFNKPITMVGNTANAGVIANYAINGGTRLPDGTQIRANIMGYDNHDNVTDSITIILPEGQYANQQSYLIDAQNSMLTVSQSITAVTGETLSNGGMIRLPFQYGDAKDIASLALSSDAVWGNHADEQRSHFTGDNAEAKYYQALKSALNDEKYRKVILTDNVDLSSAAGVSVFGAGQTMTINRAVDLDMNGYSITGNVTVSTTDAVDEMKIFNSNNAVRSSVINGSAANENNKSATLTVNAGSVRDFVVEDVTVNANGNVEGRYGNTYAVSINDVYKDTFKNRGTLNGNILITDSNGFGFENVDGVGTLENGCVFDIDSNGEVILKGNLSRVGTMNVTGPATLRLEDSCEIDADIRLSAAGTRVIVDSKADVAGAKLIAEADNIRVQVAIEKLSVKGNTSGLQVLTNGGKFVLVDENNRAITGSALRDFEDMQSSAMLQYTLEKLPIAGADSIVNDKDVTIVTTSAISSTALDVKALRDSIQAVRYNASGEADNAAGAQGPFYALTVSYNLNSHRVVDKDYKPIEGAVSGEYDTVTVTLRCNGVTVTREIRIVME